MTVGLDIRKIISDKKNASVDIQSWTKLSGQVK